MPGQEGRDAGIFPLPSLYNFLYSVATELRQKSFEEFVKDRRSAYGRTAERPLTRDEQTAITELMSSAYRMGNSLALFSSLKRKERQLLVDVAIHTAYEGFFCLSQVLILVERERYSDDQRFVIDQFGQVGKKLAFPFCMTGKRKDGGRDADLTLTSYPWRVEPGKIDPKALTRTDDRTIDALSAIYLFFRGAAEWFWERVNLPSLSDAQDDEASLTKKTTSSIREYHRIKIRPINFLAVLSMVRSNHERLDFFVEPNDPKNSRKGLSEQIIPLLLEIYQYFSLDIESYLKARTRDPSYEEMVSFIESRNRPHDLPFPTKFERPLLLGSRDSMDKMDGANKDRQAQND